MASLSIVQALSALLLFGAVALGHRRARGGWRVLLALLLVGLAFAIGTHRWPGFASWTLIESRPLSVCATPFRWTLHLDKPLVALVLLLVSASLWPVGAGARPKRVTAAVLAGGTAALLAAACALGHLRWQPGWPSFAGLWLIVHLFVVVIPEEALFRGFVLRELERGLGGIRHGAGLALAASALLFGLAHAGGGIVYAALATLAGLFYGWLWQSGRSLWWPVAGHFLVNAAHFVLFTYPAWNGRPCP